MKWLIIILFLVSFGSVCMAGVGDVYYCVVTSSVQSSDWSTGTNKFDVLKNHTKKFKFRWVKEEEGWDREYIEFDLKGEAIFHLPRLTIKNTITLDDEEYTIFYALNTDPNTHPYRNTMSLTFNNKEEEGTLYYSMHLQSLIYGVIASCSKF